MAFEKEWEVVRILEFNVTFLSIYIEYFIRKYFLRQFYQLMAY